MVVGNRGETVEEKRIRYIAEMETDIELWQSELDNAKDEKFKKYCRFMIEVCENTLEQLKNYQI